MKILLIATGFAPYSFSENITNSKLVLAFLSKGWEVDVISRKDEGDSYSTTWDNEWKELEILTHEVTYSVGNKFTRIADTLVSTLIMGYPLEGVRWAKRAYKKALELHIRNQYDVVISRSPSDISHLAAYKFSKETGVKLISNWNDPVVHIWPEPYTKDLSWIKKKLYNNFTNKIISHADINTFPSEDLKNYFLSFFKKLDEKKCHVIPHIGFLSINIDKSFDETSSFKMCHAGNLSVERNPELIFQAIVKFISKNNNDTITVDLLGVANDNLLNLIKNYSLEKNIKFIGSLPYMDALKEMSKYDVLLIIEADLKDGIFLPTKVIDYAQLGIPLLAITPNNSCVDKLIKKYGGGESSDCSSVDSIYEAIQKMYNTWLFDSKMPTYDSVALYSEFKAERIIGHYKKIFKEIKIC